ncbi:MAG TPA: response regulator [Polyangiales bacterium]
MRSGRILVVEDEAIIARGIELQLRERGHTVVAVADSGALAITLAQQHLPDIVLMDIQLRGALDGARTARTLRERFDIPSVFLSAFSDDETIERTYGAEPFGYVIKPYEERMLHITVQSALYRRLAELEHRTAEVERRRADRAEATARLAASVVHEVNNLLSAIRCNAYLIQGHDSLGGDVIEAVTDIATAVTRGEALMNDLSTLARERRATPLAIEVAELVRSTAGRADSPAATGVARPAIAGLAPASSAVARPVATANATHRGTVLVTDDDPVVRRAVTRFLKSWGCRVLDAAAPVEALAILEREAVDLLVTDLVMPEMSGYELAQRALRRAPKLGVIYMSGYQPETLASTIPEGGLRDAVFLQKPFDVPALKRAVIDMLDARALG